MTIVGATTRITSGFITTILASYLFFFSGVHEPLAQEHLHYHNPSDAFASISSSPSSTNSYPSRLVPIDIWEEASPSYKTHHRHHQDQEEEEEDSYHREKVYQRTEGPERILVHNNKHELDRERELELLQLKREEERIKEDLYRLRQERERQLRLKQQEEEEWEKEFQRRRRRSAVRGNVNEDDDYMKGSHVMEPRMNPSPDVLEMDQRLNVHRSDLPWNELFLSATLGFLIILSYFLAKLHEKATTEWSNSSTDEDDMINNSSTNIVDEEDIQRMEKSLFNQDNNKVNRKKMSYGRSSALDTQQNFATTPTPTPTNNNNKNNDNNNRYSSYRWSPSTNQSSAFIEVKESGVKPIIVKNVTPSSHTSTSYSTINNNSSIKQNEEQQKEVSDFENDERQPLEVKEPVEMVEETEKEIHRHEDDLEESLDSFESPKTENLNNKKSSGKMDGSFIFIDKTSPRQGNTA